MRQKCQFSEDPHLSWVQWMKVVASDDEKPFGCHSGSCVFAENHQSCWFTKQDGKQLRIIIRIKKKSQEREGTLCYARYWCGIEWLFFFFFFLLHGLTKTSSCLVDDVDISFSSGEISSPSFLLLFPVSQFNKVISWSFLLPHLQPGSPKPNLILKLLFWTSSTCQPQPSPARCLLHGEIE